MSSVYLGTQGWSYKSWGGNFYPANTVAGDYLKEYSKHFRAVEIDSTFYGTPRAQTVTHWREVTPDDFRFAAKFPQAITHEKMLKDVTTETLRFVDTMALLSDKLGPLVLQFPYQFKPDQHEALAAFLSALPAGFRYAVEVRHRGWLNDALFDLLEKHHVALVLAEYAYMPKIERATTDFVYIRWLGNRKDIPDDHYETVRINREAELDQWGDLITQFLEKGVTVWGFANNHYQGHSPATVRSIAERIRGLDS
jgi:uncharacterized protein YecE (DUF72 family)